MSTGMRKWMENGCPEIQCLPAQVSIDREELTQLRAELDKYKTERDALRAKIEQIEQIEQMERQEPIAYQGKVPDGWPTEEMTTAFARVFNSRDQYGTFPQAFRAALAVAPEAKL